jgi:uncharacterized protein (TIGR02302 family)
MVDATASFPPRRGDTSDAFELKVRRSRLALFFEQLWPRLWLVISVVALFLVASLGGLWALLDPLVHKFVLAMFGLALVAAAVFAARVPWPSREAAIRRIELRSGLPHRPATSYEDNLTINRNDPATQAIWQAHRSRLSELVRRLRVGRPSPRTDRRDPFAVRALLMLAVVMLLGLVGDSARDRVMAAFRFGPPMTAAEARLDAWVTPPAYTARPPLLLADGARGGLLLAGSDGKPLEVPENSVVVARTSGKGAVQLELEVRGEGSADKSSQRIKVEPKKDEAPSDVSEVRYTLRRSGEVRVFGAGSELVKWSFVVIPDKAPKITMTRPPEISRRGSIKTFYKMEDDYGIASADLVFERLEPDSGDPRTAWAREENELKGPRLPYDRPPALTLRQPSLRAKDKETWSFHELASHPWTGMRARMTLVVKDHAGNVGHSQTIEMTVPERRFFRPLARAVIEQRRLLAEDSRYRLRVVRSLDALTYEPAGFIDDRSVFLGLRSARHRLVRDKSREGISSVREHLWHIALRIEDGRSLSDAERRLRELQEQLSRAIQNGASQEEIQRLMQELRQALNQYLQELARQGQNMPQMDQNQLGQNQMMSQQDLERMMNQLENMLRQGSREMAQEMLSQLRDLLDRLQRGQMGQMGQMGQGQGQQMMQMLDQMGDMIRRQQQLQDDTFGEQRRQRGPGQQGEGQDGQQGQRDGQGQGQGNSPGDLARRQGQLRDQLGRLRDGLRRFGQQAPGQFDGAAEAMENSRRALERGDLETATREEGRALEQLRQGAQQMAEQMMRQMGRQFGRGPNGEVPRDPLGRPQRSEGPDLGTTVKVPDEIDVQRAREIMEELRRRLGEQNRPTLELDYIERLLRRF